VERGAKPLVLVCIVSKAMCGYDRCVAPSAQSGYSAILKGEWFFSKSRP